ncbi:maestro heat-like repeat-containing protein family member 2B [Chlamydotis macqueenii]
MTLLSLRAVLSRVGSGRILRAVCCVLEQWLKGVGTYLCDWERCPFPRRGLAHFCEAIYPVFQYAVVHWRDCEEEEDRQAVLEAVTAMLELLLREEQHRERAWEQLLWVLQQCAQLRDTSRVTKSLSCALEMLEGVQTPVSQGTALTISTAVHRQLSDVTKEPGPACKALLSRCILLQARVYPGETVEFLQSQLSSGSQAGRVAALGLLGVLARADAPAMREKLPQVVEAVRSVCGDPSAQVRRAVLEFIRELLSLDFQSCWAWDVVGHIFTEFSRTLGRPVAGGLFSWETEEDKAIRTLCMDIVGSLDVSLRGMTKLLWPRLLQYVMPAQYSGMLVPLSRCLRALAERRERAGCEQEEEEPDAMDTQERALLPAPQALLVRLLVVAAGYHASGQRAAAALQLLQALHSRIHRALGAVWATEIPLLLQCLEGKTESCLCSAEWEHRVLKFLRASLERIEEKGWTVGLSQELSRQLGSSAPGSWEKLFLCKALGTALAACRDLRHVQGQVLRFLEAANCAELSESQGMVCVVSHAAESHFEMVLDTVSMAHATFSRDWTYLTLKSWKVCEKMMEKAQGTCAALMRTLSGIALHAPKEQLLSHVDKEIMGNILRLSRAKEKECQLKLALVESITEVSCAIQAVGDCGSFELSLKQEAMWTLLGWIKEEPRDALVYGVFQALEQLSKLRPPLSRKENQKVLTVCCQCLLSGPSEERMKRRRRTVRAAVNMQVLQRRGLEDLGHLIETLLEAEACFDDVVDVLIFWLTSAKEWERERALQVCAHVLGACQERFGLVRRDPCKEFGFLVGLLGTLTSDCLAASRRAACVCLGHLLQMHGTATEVVPQAEEIRHLCEELEGPDKETLLETTAKIAEPVCKCIPAAQATAFLRAILGSLLHTPYTSARAAQRWVLVFLAQCSEEILQEIPEILDLLYSCTQHSIHRPFLLSALFLLAHSHREPVITSLLQRGLPRGSAMLEVWRSLGKSCLGIEILRCLVEKLNRAGDNGLGADGSAGKRHDLRTALEILTITEAICEVALAVRDEEQLRELLPHLLPSLLRRARETLGEERLPPSTSSWRQLFFEGRVLEQKPCRIFLSAMELVLGKCVAQEWMWLLLNQAVWVRLENPMAHAEGLRLLNSVLLQAGVRLPGAEPPADSWSVKLRLSRPE